MSNKEIAAFFNQLAKIMELHDENKFKIRSYSNAYLTIRKLDQPLIEMDTTEINALKGVGKAISAKIKEIIETGESSTLNRYNEITPPGVRELLSVKGFGPKKIYALWKDLGIESPIEALYACNENRLIDLKGFGEKTQKDFKKKLEYFLKSRNKYHYASLEDIANDILANIVKANSKLKIDLVGQMRRKTTIVDQIDFLIAGKPKDFKLKINELDPVEDKEDVIKTKYEENIPVNFHFCSADQFGIQSLQLSTNEKFRKQLKGFEEIKKAETEEAVFEQLNINYIIPEWREPEYTIKDTEKLDAKNLVEETDLKGVLHNHSTYSDGIHTLKKMAEFTRSKGYQYLGISDHSKAAFYANGLKEDRLLQQWEEIDKLNKKWDDFKIFKSIESDILNDGSLDYEEEILKQFDFVIASVHTNLKMDKEKATARLITAIENPYTKILGHPTGRLLLAREGYPIDHKKVIDACSKNGVSIELNANPYRLDIDWRWIPYCMSKDVKIAINPDAHSKEGILHMHFGTIAARKGGLTKVSCLNAMETAEFQDFISH